MADGEDDGVLDTDAEGEGELEGVFDTDADGDGEVDGDVDAEADGEVEGELDAEAEAITVPRFPSIASHLYRPALTVTEISDRKSLASAKVACVSPATLKPPVAVTTMSPPPSVFMRRTSRMPGFVGLGSVRVSAEPPLVISQICRSMRGRMIPPVPGSLRIFGPL